MFSITFDYGEDLMEFKGVLLSMFPVPDDLPRYPRSSWFEGNGCLSRLPYLRTSTAHGKQPTVVIVVDWGEAVWHYLNPDLGEANNPLEENYSWGDFRDNVLRYNEH